MFQKDIKKTLKDLFNLSLQLHSCFEYVSQCSPMAVGPPDISGNDWCGPVNSSPVADRMSDEKFQSKSRFFGRNLSLRPAKNDHVHPLGHAMNCEEVKKE